MALLGHIGAGWGNNLKLRVQSVMNLIHEVGLSPMRLGAGTRVCVNSDVYICICKYTYIYIHTKL